MFAFRGSAFSFFFLSAARLWCSLSKHWAQSPPPVLAGHSLIRKTTTATRRTKKKQQKRSEQDKWLNDWMCAFFALGLARIYEHTDWNKCLCVWLQIQIDQSKKKTENSEDTKWGTQKKKKAARNQEKEERKQLKWANERENMAIKRGEKRVQDINSHRLAAA